MFKTTYGVKQGGVLSPILFALYLDEWVKRLKLSGARCYIWGLFMGAFAYANDLTLIAPTKIAMYKLPHTATEFSTE